MRIKLIILAVCIIFIALLALPQQAQAKPATDCSIPYIVDVNDYGKRYVATIEIAGKPHTVKAFCGKRRVHIDRIGRTVWMMPFSKGKLYTIKAKAKGGKYHVIKYVMKEA